MQIPITITALWVVLSYILYLLLSRFVQSRRQASTARELKCEDPPFLKNKYPGGIDHLIKALEDVKTNTYPDHVTKRMEEAGAITYKYSSFGSINTFTADEKNVQAVLATQFSDFDLGEMRRGNFWPLLGNGIFTQDGPGWEHSRAMMRPQFARDQVSDLEMTERHVQHLMRALDVTHANGWTEALDLQVLFFRFTLDTATEFLFGESVDSQVHLLANGQGETRISSKSQAPADFARAFDVSQQQLAERYKFSTFYYLCNPKGFKENCKVCHDFIDHFVRLALSKGQQGKDTAKDGIEKEKYVFLDALASQTRDPVELRSQLLNILLAGRDTTASLMGWLFYNLARDPARYTKLRNKVIEEFGTYDHPKGISFSRLKRCHYLQHCNNETLRLYPVVPFNTRTANRDTTLPRGGGKDGKSKIFIPKGAAVDYSVHLMHHRKDIWGEDVEDFNPERWEGRKSGWEFLPFNGGPRICIGQQFALTESSYVTVRLVQRFDKIENLEIDPVVRHNVGLTNCSANGVKVRLHAV